MQKIVDSLSLPNQKLDVDYYNRVLNFTNRAVIAAPCGWGKTLGVAEYITENYDDGILYVAERKNQLDSMKKILVQQHKVLEENIGLYYSGSKDLELLQKNKNF